MQIHETKEGGTIVFDQSDWTSSLAPNYQVSSFPTTQKGKQLTFSRAVNPFRNWGYVTPGFLPTDVTNVSVVTNYIRNGIVNGTMAYLIDNGSLIHQLDLTNNTLTNGGAFPHTVVPTGGINQTSYDFALYTAKVNNASALRSFYSYSTSAVWDVGTFDLNATFNDTFMSTQPNTPLGSTGSYLTGGANFPHPLILGDDDILYMGDRNYLHAYDGQNSADVDGKFFPAVLTLPNGYIITSFIKVDQGLLIFTYFNNLTGTSYFLGRARAWLWNYNDLDITRAYDLNDNLVSEAFQNAAGQIGCFTQGRPNDPSTTRTSSLQLFDGGKFVKVATFPENIPIRGGVDIVGNSVQFLTGINGSNAAIYSYDSPLVGVPAKLNRIAEVTGSTSGMLKTFTSTTQFASSGSTTSGGLQTTSSDYYSQCSVATGLAEPVFPIYKKGRIKNVKIRFATTNTPANSRNITIQLRDRNGTISTVLDQLTDVSTQALMTIDRNNDSAGNAFIEFDGLRAFVFFAGGNGSTDAPILDAIQVDYENINITPN